MKLIATALTLIATCAGLHAQAVVNTVPTYDAITNPNIRDIVNVAPPLTYFNFITSVAVGWPGNVSGVVNFDQPQSLTPYPAPGISSIKAQYGAALTNVMLVSFGNPVDMANSVGPQVPISGLGVLRQPIAAPLVFKLSPTNLLPNRRVGLTVLQQQNPQLIRVEFFQAGGPTLTASQVVPVAPIPTRDVFFGRQATAAGGIIAVRISVTHPGTGLPLPFAIDDLAWRQ